MNGGFMKRLLLTILLLGCTGIASARNYETSGTGMSGGITLFDSANPMVGLNNPALLDDYHRMRTPVSSYAESPVEMTDDPADSMLDNSMNPLGLVPRYGFGRLFLANVYFGANVSAETLEGMSYYLPLLRTALGPSGLGVDEDIPLFGSTTLNLPSLIRIMTLGSIDTTPLFQSYTETGDYALISNIIDLVMNDADSPGAYVFYNLNLLSYYRHNFGFSIYSSSDVLAGLFSDDRTLLLVSDPVVDIHTEVGISVSVGHGEVNLPFIGKVSIGSTYRLYALVEGHTENVSDALRLYEQLDLLYQHLENASTLGDYLDVSALGDGSLAKGGIGLGCDLGFVKKVSSHLIIAGKFSDVISPVYWLNSSSLGWKAPDLSMGVKYTLPVDKRYWLLVNEPNILVQLDDMLYTYPVSFLAKLHLGFNVKTLGDFLELGLGLNQGYPTLGFTLHITPAILAKIPVIKYLFYVTAPVTFFHVKYNFTIYGKELGQYPGDFGFEGYNTGLEAYIGF